MFFGLKRIIGPFRSGVLILPLVMFACVPMADDTDVMRPEDRGDLSVTGRTDTAEVFEGLAVTLTAEAMGGTQPYSFRWDLNTGPEDLSLTDVTSDTLTTGPLTTLGRYVFRMIVTDSEGRHATGFVAVEAIRAVTADAPKLAVVGERVELSAIVAAQMEDAVLTWEVTQGTASLDDETSPNPSLTTTLGETVEILLTVTLSSAGASPVTTTRSFEIVSVFDLAPQVLIETNLGSFSIELNGEAAPLHTVNFLLHVDDGFYDGLLFHRNACSDNPDTGECEPFVLQGGGYRPVDDEPELQEPPRDPVASEADNGLSNATLHSVALALTGGDPDSGTTQFFVNLADNSFLDDRSFTVFGMVVEGTDAVDAIVATETVSSSIIPGEVSLPAEDVIIERISRVDP